MKSKITSRSSTLTTSLLDWIYRQQYFIRQWGLGKLYSLKPKNRVLNEDVLNNPKKVLIILSGLLGDSVMSSPVISEARRLWQKAEITLLGKKQNCELLSACPFIDNFIETSVVPFSWRRISEVRKLKEEIKSKRFDIAIILLGDQFAHLLAQAQIPIRVGVKEHPLAPCLTHHYSIGSPRTWGPEERLGALRCLGYQVNSVQPKLWVDENTKRSLSDKLRSFGIEDEESYFVLHPFGSEKRQWWPLERINSLAQELYQLYGLKTILIGGPETKSQVPNNLISFIINTTGKLSIKELLATIERAQLVITTDSGPFHIAGALGRPIVGLFRGRRPEHAKRYPQAEVIFGQEIKCQRSCEWDRCSNIPCTQLNKINVDSVLQAVERVWKLRDGN